MRQLLFQIAYDGTNYHGFQVQKNALSVAEVFQNAVEQVFGRREDIIGCSRTDTGVHANHYYITCKTESSIAEERAHRALNFYLPNDIAVLDCREVPLSFHPRYDAVQKRYLYKIWCSRVQNPFLLPYAYWYHHSVDVPKMQRAADLMLGTHDFAAFCASGSDIEDTVRRMDEISLNMEGNLLTVSVTGNGFLYHMVRIMVGTLLFVSEGKILPEEIPEILEGKDRSRAGKTAPAKGLFLDEVFFDPKKEGLQDVGTTRQH